MTPARPRLVTGIAIAVGAAAGLVVGVWMFRSDSVPSARQDLGRVREIRALEPLRSGRIRVRVIPAAGGSDRDSPGSGGDTIRYSLQAPGWRVEDTEIRGLLGAEPKYPFNQGTAYHMRLGRRFAGPSEGLYELKRGLARWELSPLPAGSRVLSASVRFWIERHDVASPLANRPVPLHLYAYPVEQRWVEGRGGVRADNFSPASRGEVTWTDARAGIEPWPSSRACGARPARGTSIGSPSFPRSRASGAWVVLPSRSEPAPGEPSRRRALLSGVAGAEGGAPFLADRAGAGRPGSQGGVGPPALMPTEPRDFSST